MALANAFANAADAMEYLDPSVIEITFADDAADQQEAVNIIVGYLYGRIDPAILNTWHYGTASHCATRDPVYCGPVGSFLTPR